MSTTLPPPSVHSRARDLSASASGAPVEASPPLSPSAKALAGAALAPATVRAYRSALAALDRWLAEQGRAADDAALADFLRRAAMTPGPAPAVHQHDGCRRKAPPAYRQPRTGRPVTTCPPARRIRARCQKAGAEDRPRACNGASRCRSAVAAKEGKTKLAGLRDAALVALASDCLLRVSEVVAVQVEDIAAEADGSGRLTVRRSKTDQEGKGAVLYVGEATMRRIEVCG